MRQRGTEFEINMFPFLSVLCAVIGILMLLMLMIMSTRVISADDLDEDRHAQLNAELKRLESRLAVSRSKYQETSKLHAQLTGLIAAKEELVELETAPQQGRRKGTRLGAPEKVKVVPDQQREVSKTPLLVEVTAGGFLVHPQKKECATEELHDDRSGLSTLLEQVYENRDRQYLLLLLHPNGVASYQQLRQFLKQRYRQSAGAEGDRSGQLDVGKEPFSQDWILIVQEQDRPE